MDIQSTFEELIIHGRYLLPRVKPNGKMGHCVYDEHKNPVAVISDSNFKKLKPYLKEKKGKLTVDFRLVRAAHGNNYFKRVYKALRKKQVFVPRKYKKSKSEISFTNKNENNGTGSIKSQASLFD